MCVVRSGLLVYLCFIIVIFLLWRVSIDLEIRMSLRELAVLSLLSIICAGKYSLPLLRLASVATLQAKLKEIRSSGGSSWSLSCFFRISLARTLSTHPLASQNFLVFFIIIFLLFFFPSPFSSSLSLSSFCVLLAIVDPAFCFAAALFAPCPVVHLH